MGYCIVHMQKMKMTACAGIQSHLNREHTSKTNPDIDYDKTKDNYNFVSTENLKKDINQKIDEIVQPKKAIRKDAVVCCNFVITSDNETMSNLSPEQQKEFFSDSVKFFEDRYGKDKIVYATVHMDETTPHMHLGLVPITEDNRLSAKNLFNPLELKNLQTEFFEKVGSKYDMERGLEGSTNKHLEIQKLKNKTLKEEETQLIAKTSEMGQICSNLEKKVNTLSEQKNALNRSISGLNEEFSNIKTDFNNIEKIEKEAKIKKDIFGKEKNIIELPKNIFDFLIKMLKKLSLKDKNNETKIKELNQEIKELKAENKKLKPSMNERIEQADEIAKLKGILKKIPKDVIDRYLNPKEIKSNKIERS